MAIMHPTAKSATGLPSGKHLLLMLVDLEIQTKLAPMPDERKQETLGAALQLQTEAGTLLHPRLLQRRPRNNVPPGANALAIA